MQPGDRREYINARDLLVQPVKERTTDTHGNASDHRNVRMGQPGIPSNSPMKPQQAPTQKPFIAFGISTMTPPIVDPQTTMPRAEEVNAIQLMINDSRTSAVTLIGAPGIGKSTLAALLYQRLLLAKQRGLPSPTHMVWLTVNSYTTLPDLIGAMLNGINMYEPGLFQLKADQQVTMLLHALRRSQESAFIVLDQFETLLYPEVSEGIAGRGALPTLLSMLQTDLGASRILLTNHDSLSSGQQANNSRMRSYATTHMSMPEGIGLLQQRQVRGTPEQLSLAWQQCAGNVFSLVQLRTLIYTSKTTLETLLQAPVHKSIWTGNVTLNLIAQIYRYLTPLQSAILQVLSLFTVPAPIEGIIMTITGTTIAKQRRNIQTSVAIEQDLLYLLQAGLIQRLNNTRNQPCYTLNPLLRNYILEHFIDDNQAQAPNHRTPAPINTPTSQSPQDSEAHKNALATAHVQVANYYKNAIQEHCPPRERRTSPLDVEPVIGAIRHLCLSWRWQQACDLLFHEGLEESLLTWGTWNTLLGLYLGLLPPTGVLTDKDEGLVAGHVAMLYGRLGEYQQSQKYFEQALRAQRASRDRRGEAMTLTNQGEIMRLHGEHKQARINFERAMSLEQEPDDNLRCVILHNLGLISQYENDHKQAIQCYTEALRLAVKAGKQDYKGIIITNLGLTLYQNHEYLEGLALLLAALQMREETSDSSLSLLERFLAALEQKIGHDGYARLCQEATAIQPKVFARFMPADIR